jgi:hypothetical protein
MLQTRAGQEMDSIMVNSHAVFETRFDICYKPELRQEMDYIMTLSIFFLTQDPV